MPPSLVDRDPLAHVGETLSHPEALAAAFATRQDRPKVVGALLLAAIAGMAGYGLTLGFPHGAGRMALSALQAPLAAGAAFALSLPAFWVVRAFLGSRLPLGVASFAALVAVTWGALALLASVPISWFFELALPHPTIRVALHATILLGTGTAMADTLLRTLRALEPTAGRLFPLCWLGLVAALAGELAVLLGLF